MRRVLGQEDKRLGRIYVGNVFRDRSTVVVPTLQILFGYRWNDTCSWSSEKIIYRAFRARKALLKIVK